MVLLAAMALCVMAALHLGWFDKRTPFERKISALNASQKPDAILHDVNGIYGWTLGDTLPGQLSVATNATLGGNLVYDVPSDDANEDQPHVMWLVLTEERQIASIYVSIPKNTQKDAVFNALREKYGFRTIAHNSLEGDYYAYFGTTNRQAVFGQQLGVFGSMSVEYRDERLCQIAEQQQEKRKSAEEKQKADEIRSHL
jgi:hypothetical protein